MSTSQAADLDHTEDAERSLDLLSAVLRGNHFQSQKIRSSILIDALIGGEWNDYQFSGRPEMRPEEYTYTLPPLIFNFARMPRCTEIILKNILYDAPPQDNQGKYQNNESGELLRLLTYMHNSATNEMETKATHDFTRAAIAEAMKAGHAETLKKIYNLGMNSARTTPSVITERSTLLQNSIFAASARAATPTAIEHSALAEKLNSCLTSTREKLNKDNSVKDIELHAHKINVLQAAQGYLQGTLPADEFQKIKQDNPRYAEGMFSSAVKDIVLEVEAAVNGRTGLTPPLLRHNCVLADARTSFFILLINPKYARRLKWKNHI